MKKLLGLFLFAAVLLSGCGGNKLRPDTVVGAIDANYATAEFSSCNEMFNGLGICYLQKGESLGDLKLAVQGYYKGTIQFATTCPNDSNIPLSYRYEDNQKVGLDLRSPVNDSCGISFVVSPEYPTEKDQPIEIKSLKGHLYVKVIGPNDKIFSQILKIKEGANPSESLLIKTVESKVDISLRSTDCGISYDASIPSQNGEFRIQVKDFFPIAPVKTCIISGVYFEGGVPVRMVIFYEGYAKEFIPLPIPNVSFDGPQIKIESDDNVSIVSVDDKYEIDRSASFDFDKNSNHIIRALTVKGRSVIGIYSPNGGFKWLQ